MRYWLMTAVLWFILGALSTQAQEPMTGQFFDTGAVSASPLTGDAIAKRSGWAAVPEDQLKHAFKGDVVITNGRLALALRRAGRGAEVYALGPDGPARRAELVAVGGAPAVRFKSVKIIENNPGSVALEAAYKVGWFRTVTVAYRLNAGQVFVETLPRKNAKALRLEAPCRFAVLPDFFADDIVIDAADLPARQAELPSENFLMHMVDGAIVMAVWNPAQEDVRVDLAGEGSRRTITGSEIRYGEDGKVCIAVLDGASTWHRRDIAASDAGQILPLGWKAPFMAQWRVDWRKDDGLTDSWEMLTQKPDGEYEKHGWYGQVEAFGNVDWLKSDRERWTTVLGRFFYPCWLDKNGEGYLQPLAKKVKFEGPAVIYPINRIEATPIEAFTVVDVMRATLGVGPCEYILDVEGQKKKFEGRPTCASRTILDTIYGAREQVQKKDEVLRTLDEVLAFMQHIRGRIEDYQEFGHETAAWLEQQKKKQPQMAGFIDQMLALTRKIDENVAGRRDKIRPPEDAAALVHEFRTSLVGYDGADALEKCKKLTAQFVGIGGAQDELVGESRLAVKILRQRASMAMAADPAVAPVARELRRRTQAALRNPASYEAPRH